MELYSGIKVHPRDYSDVPRKISKCFKEKCPLVSCKCKRYNKPTKLWISSGILKSIQVKNLLFKKYVSEPNQVNKSNLVNYKNKLSN